MRDAERRRYVLRELAKYVTAETDKTPPKDDIDVFRLALTRRIKTFLGDPRRCREPICRRSKFCLGPDLRCARDFPAPPSTPEERSRALAEVYYALKRRLSELDGVRP